FVMSTTNSRIDRTSIAEQRAVYPPCRPAENRVQADNRHGVLSPSPQFTPKTPRRQAKSRRCSDSLDGQKKQEGEKGMGSLPIIFIENNSEQLPLWRQTLGKCRATEHAWHR